MALRVDPDPVLVVNPSKMDDIVTGDGVPGPVCTRTPRCGPGSYRLFGKRGPPAAPVCRPWTESPPPRTAWSTSSVDDDGNFEVIPSADEQLGNWLRLAGASGATVRNFLYDWDTETPAALTIERIWPGVDPGERAVAPEVSGGPPAVSCARGPRVHVIWFLP